MVELHHVSAGDDSRSFFHSVATNITKLFFIDIDESSHLRPLKSQTNLPPSLQSEREIERNESICTASDFFGFPHPKSVSQTSSLGDPATTTNELPGFNNSI